MNDIGGVWRTVGGRRIFIKDGQSLSDAMKESGKFDTSERNNIIEELERINNLEKELQEASYKAYERLDEKEIEALNYYTRDGYYDINDYLNKNYDLSFGEEVVGKLNSSIDKFNYNKEYSVYSGTNIKHYENYKIGDIIDTNRFISSSTSIDVAECFAMEKQENGMLLKINVKPNSKSMYIGISSGSFVTERETLFSNTQKYKVIGITEREKKYGIGNYKVLEVETYE